MTSEICRFWASISVLAKMPAPSNAIRSTNKFKEVNISFLLTGYRQGTDLPLIDCTVTHCPNRWQNITPAPARRLRALIDTGATHVFAQPEIIAELGLPHVSDMETSFVGGSDVTPGYACQVTLHGTEVGTGRTFDSNTDGVLIMAKRLVGFDLLLGWDVLRFYDLSFPRHGTYQLAGH